MIADLSGARRAGRERRIAALALLGAVALGLLAGQLALGGRWFLIALLAEVEVAPSEVIVQGADETLPQRLAAYWQARNRFVQAGRAIKPSADVRVVLAQVREPLMSVLCLSPDFRPAYDPLLQMAAALALTDGTAASALLGELSAVQPARGEAAALLREVDQATP